MEEDTEFVENAIEEFGGRGRGGTNVNLYNSNKQDNFIAYTNC